MKRTGLRRRTLLAALPALSITGGCVNQIRTTVGRDRPSRVRLELLTLPRDDDLFSLPIANHLRDMLEIAGIAVDVSPIRPDAFLRDVLVNHDYDLYVWRHPGLDTPDILRTLLHSRFIEERGWQNPFGFSNGSIDELLDQQHRSNSDKLNAVPDLLELIDQECPFLPIGFERRTRVTRTDTVLPSEWPVEKGAWIFGIRPPEDDPSNPFSLTFGTTDARVTKNFNPLSVEYREHHHLPAVVYDPLVRKWGEDYVRWLVADTEWLSPRGARSPTIECELREGLRWHDDELLTASDVAFTFRLYKDTTLADGDPVVPTTAYRRRTSHVDAVEAVDDRTVRIQFEDTSRSTATDALTVPILPAHVWSDRTELTEVAGIVIAQDTTEALVADNLNPVGSGPYEVDAIEEEERIVLSRNPDHFATRGSVGPVPAAVLDELEIEVRPSIGSLVDSVRSGTLDGSIVNVGPDPAVSEEMLTITNTTDRLLHVGFNHRRSPMSNRQFRVAVARCVDHHYLQHELLGEKTPITRVPLRDDELVPPSLAGPDAVTERFLGEPGSGEIDEETARENFREAGFSYSEDGELLQRQ